MTAERTTGPRTSGEHVLSDPELVADPYGAFGRIREEAPVARGRLWDGGPVWIVTRHDDVSAVLLDRRFASNAGSLPGRTDEHAEFLARTVGIPEDVVPYLAGNLVYLDPPDHTRLRGLVARAFTPRRIARLRPRVEAITGELLDTLPDRAVDGVVDLIEHFAYPLPVSVICELLGVPEEDRPRWHAWSRRFGDSTPRRLGEIVTEMNAHIRELVERRRAEPADDLLTALTGAHDGGGRLSDAELVTMVLTLMIAGHTTTSHMLGNGIAALLAHPGQLARLREDPALMPGAVQELLRWGSPVVIAKLRYATQDVTIGDTLIRQGERVQLVLGSANRDPRRFPDGDRLDVERPCGAADAQHLAYARGPHYCLGAALANQEAEVAFSALFTRFPELALAVPPDRLERDQIPITHQLARLPVTLGPPSADAPSAGGRAEHGPGGPDRAEG
ncbi:MULTISPECIES: cytochrome P450 family protein [Actinomadura]|uniref:Cytochrome P450 n=1 Tax=Actinomadura yumaensis TaxID=111807 RepID=A0ABW2CK70_9ACTN|nr:cytochrome P450 [Actinomadura sp. J1-007]MWK40680.1 cytochrome P450 [Actinomadura sp. J1-007]QFU19834.1 cytochrome P450 [Actinomadura sp.]